MARDLENDLFSDVETSKDSDDSDSEIGLIKKKKGEKSDEYEERKGITITVSPRTVERTVFITLIIVLAGLFFYNPFYEHFPWADGGNQITGAVVAGDNTDTPAAEDATKETKPSEKPAATNDDPSEDEVSDQETTDPNAEDASEDDSESDTVIAGGERTLTIDDYDYEQKEWGIKMTNVKFILENAGESFIPKIRAYAYDKDTRSTYEQSPEIKLYSELGSGKRLIGTISLEKFSFSDKTTEKTVVLKLYDEGGAVGYANDKHVTTVDQKFTVP